MATTIKVPEELRDRINAYARRRGLSAAGLIAELLEEHERSQRWARLASAYKQSPPDFAYWDEFRDFEIASGLDD